MISNFLLWKNYQFSLKWKYWPCLMFCWHFFDIWYMETANPPLSTQISVAETMWGQHLWSYPKLHGEKYRNHYISGLLISYNLNLCRKQLRDPFTTTTLHETLSQILDLFMSRGSPHHWADYVMPEDARLYKQAVGSSSGETISITDTTKFEQLMAEARAVLSRYLYNSGQENVCISEVQCVASTILKFKQIL